ncbi:MAG: hypothetical protein IIY81_12280 [Lachnospiraceae bacterium]|nr:hypothetical protein [Lachnospiraceae bacterium]
MRLTKTFPKEMLYGLEEPWLPVNWGNTAYREQPCSSVTQWKNQTRKENRTQKENGGMTYAGTNRRFMIPFPRISQNFTGKVQLLMVTKQA